jgi:deoxyribodipyrimidine photolyase
MKRNLALYWFRDDLRLADNPAIMAAAKHDALTCVYVLETNPSFRSLGGAARWWLAQSLRKLSADLARNCCLASQMQWARQPLRGIAAMALPRPRAMPG